ncbi:HlyD family type I secretion periplasmic adaptor subunit [Hydrogenophaga sp. BPS33]|uniref:HlyD family type I secretion periplasmic adaptor subunit n=1 Tax=Hydrogenophaga sp. BPS33 TaxID=2651974 RepID=UPI00131F5C4D|nr:HlyD family type I secretion periplasmic adaptor subunit [Hydrogenophaga sp. BPS33]QHE87173.1 HlyD family type I secretion periplasmic adaptor subunit [Hydrogenophaga sp. BPS33]
MKILWFLEPNKRSKSDQGPLSEQLRGSRWVMWVTFLSIGLFVAWAWHAELDQVTRAPGSVIASSRTQLIQSQDGGTLEEMLVREGDKVEAGQLLARIERTRAESAFLETRAKAAALSASLARLQAEVFGGQPRYAAELKNYPDFSRSQNDLLRKRRAALDEDLTAIRRMKSLVEEELSLNLPLVQSGDVSRTEVLRLQRQVADMQAQMTNKRNKYFQDAQAEFNKTQEELAGVQQILAQRRNQLDQTELRAPLRGVVKNVRITTQGGVIRPGEEVMQIVPLEDDLVIEAKVSPADIAFLTLGLDATVKIDAYDYTVYGGLPGKLIFISADTLSENLRQGEDPYYRVQVRTTSREFSKRAHSVLEIQPGMTATIEVKTGQRTVLQYLAKPIVKTLGDSLGER